MRQESLSKGLVYSRSLVSVCPGAKFQEDCKGGLYVSICACVHRSIHQCMYTCIYRYVNMCTPVYTGMYVNVHIHVHFKGIYLGLWKQSYARASIGLMEKDH